MTRPDRNAQPGTDEHREGEPAGASRRGFLAGLAASSVGAMLARRRQRKPYTRRVAGMPRWIGHL